MTTRDDIESYLIRMDLVYDEVDDGMYLVRSGTSDLPVVVHCDDTLLHVSMKVIDLPRQPARETALYRTLLELNASEVIHGAYAIEGNDLILSNTLELETLDFNELQASLESIELSATSHMGRVSELAGVGGRRTSRSHQVGTGGVLPAEEVPGHHEEGP